jgi:hypothetical protein
MKAIDLSALDEVEARLGETHSRIAAQMAEVSRLQADGADDTQALYVLQDLQETIHQQIECAEKLLRDYEGELNQTVGPPLFKPRQPAEGAEQRFIVGNVRGG